MADSSGTWSSIASNRGATSSTDCTTRTGDVCDKIGTCLKAQAAHDNGVPFCVAPPRWGRL